MAPRRYANGSMQLADQAQDAAFRREVQAWFQTHVIGDFAAAQGRGGQGDEAFEPELRRAWEKELARGGWTCVGWPTQFGGRGASITQQVIFNEEYVRSGAPGRFSILGEGLLGPTIIHFGTKAQQERFLPPIVAGEEMWCQGYSEPNAGSDLANVATRAEFDGKQWSLYGQKVWTSLAHEADWCFVVARSEAGSRRHRGLSYFLVPMDQPGIEVRPIVQLSGTSEFNEVFFDGAKAQSEDVVGEVGDGWRVALATLSFERGVGLLGHLLGFSRELEHVITTARGNGRIKDATVRDRLARAYGELAILQVSTVRSLAGYDDGEAPPSASVAKLFWAGWHQRLGELALDVLGPAATVIEGSPYELGEFHRSFLFSRSESIYGGSDEVQRNIIGERVLGLPPEPKGTL